jgi:hypothetical protein
MTRRPLNLARLTLFEAETRIDRRSIKRKFEIAFLSAQALALKASAGPR